MQRKFKLLNKAIRSTNNLGFHELIILAELFGFEKKRQKGSHVMMVHSTHDLFLNFQSHKGKAKPYQIRQLISLIKEYNL